MVNQTAYSYSVVATDPDNHTLSYSLNVAPPGMNIDANSGEISWSPGQVGDHPVTVQVTDAYGSLTEQSYTLTVTNSSPAITSTPIGNAEEGIVYQYAVQASDADGDTLTYSLFTAPTGMAIDSASGLITWDTPVTGQYNVILQVDDGANVVDQDYILTVSVTGGGSGGGSGSSNNAVGVTPGEFSVDASGGANYSVPIAVPPGTSGMQPSLSLNYNSRSGNGVLGMGWTLGGLSVITRCSATEVIDGFSGGINFDDNDHFCIDGQRLISINGTYGADLTEYRTEVDGFTQVISHDTDATNNGPEHFIVKTKSGQILEYGNTTDSRIEAEGISDVRLWAVNKISDTVGDYLTVTYNEDAGNGEYYPIQIDYTGNDIASPSVAPYASVQFQYETRTDIASLYLAGSKVKNTQRLTNIQTYVGSTLVRNYQLTYDNNGAAGASRLADIEECNSSGDCFPPTSFTWPTSGDDESLDSQIANPVWSKYRFHTGDWNGDGRTDLMLQLIHASSSGTGLYMYTANEQGVQEYTGFSKGWSWQETIRISNFIRISHLVAGDWNGDGKTDIARVFCKKTVGWCVLMTDIDFYHSTGTSMVASGESMDIQSYLQGNTMGQPVFIPGDFNADGVTDLFIQTHTSSSAASALYTSNAQGQMQASGFTLPASTSNANAYSSITGDWNGDGRLDIGFIKKSSGTSYFYHSTDTGFVATGFNPTDWGGKSVVVGDWNGDGYHDALVQGTGTGATTMYHSDGQGQMLPTGFSPTDWNDYNIHGGDWNGDGKTDLALLAKNSSNISHFYGSTGDAMEAIGFNPAGWGGGHPLIVGDWNGDGVSDLWRSHKTSGNTTYQYISSSPHDRITAVTSGLGNETGITYTPLTDSSVYTKGTSAVYPEVDIQALVYVVSSVAVDDGIGGTRDTNYTYAGAKSSLDGRGFSGFETMAATDVSTGIKTTTTYKQTHPYIGLVERTEQRLSDDTLLGEVDTTFAQTQTHTGIEVDASHPGVLFPYAATVTKKDYELEVTP